MPWITDLESDLKQTLATPVVVVPAPVPTPARRRSITHSSTFHWILLALALLQLAIAIYVAADKLEWFKPSDIPSDAGTVQPAPNQDVQNVQGQFDELGRRLKQEERKTELLGMLNNDNLYLNKKNLPTIYINNDWTVDDVPDQLSDENKKFLDPYLKH